MRIIKTKVYTIDEHPNKQACYDWIRENWYNLNDYSVDEVINSIKALNKLIGGIFDYYVSQVPDKGEFVYFAYYDNDILNNLDANDCPLTGTRWDVDLIEGLKDGCPGKVLESLHESTKYTYSDEGLFELCQANEYEFTENGEIY